ncbi:hypothetical protein DN342_24155 [Salmonella enterica subsp. enterica serovar Enteritidis]|nr:hypothetical protein [Salmonella enterica subsp. enterica serovar Enteritidis]ECJ2364206.1 host cell division inhibitor Icd-like protein [Salmonella enterica subsp. diarizonae]EGU4332677.1 host cell division inhibitor Icd-like protein [Salmonella enterica]EGX1468803.1 host cell division inhibitor Icd-like protein [Salmonella enterica]
MREAENELLDRVKVALDEAGVAWIDTRTKERSKPADTDASKIPPNGEVENDDSGEGCEDIRYAVCQRQYYGDTLTRTFYLSRVFICKNAAQEYAEQYSQEFKTGQFTVRCEVTELTPQIVNEIRHEYGGITRQRFTGHCLMTGRRGKTMRNNRPCFVWRFWSCQNVTYTTTATSEREARLQLPAVRLVFIARIRMEVQSHA